LRAAIDGAIELIEIVDMPVFENLRLVEEFFHLSLADILA
jgi:hypothetical protein